MNRYEHHWQKLTALARAARDDRATTAPYGFGTRVAARAAAVPAAGPWAGFERFALRGLMVAAAFGVAAIAFNYSSLLQAEQSDDLASADTVSDMLDLT